MSDHDPADLHAEHLADLLADDQGEDWLDDAVAQTEWLKAHLAKDPPLTAAEVEKAADQIRDEILALPKDSATSPGQAGSVRASCSRSGR